MMYTCLEEFNKKATDDVEPLKDKTKDSRARWTDALQLVVPIPEVVGLLFEF